MYHFRKEKNVGMMTVMIVCDILFTDVVADAGADKGDDDANFAGALAHPTTQLSVPTGVKSRPKAFPLFWLVLISHILRA